MTKRIVFRGVDHSDLIEQYANELIHGLVLEQVVTENGNIAPGDYLTSSSTPGVAMKSNGSGPVIGQALSSYDGQDVGIVLAL